MTPSYRVASLPIEKDDDNEFVASEIAGAAKFVGSTEGVEVEGD